MPFIPSSALTAMCHINLQCRHQLMTYVLRGRFGKNKARKIRYGKKVLQTYCISFFFHRRPFTFTPLEKGSPYDAATLGFLFLVVRGAFLLEPMEAVLKSQQSVINNEHNNDV